MCASVTAFPRALGVLSTGRVRNGTWAKLRARRNVCARAPSVPALCLFCRVLIFFFPRFLNIYML